jgi:uncharacterized membrane protein
MDENILIITIFSLVGTLEIILGIPLLYEKIKPNWFYGFRLPKTVSNKKIWYKVNKQAGKDFIISGITLTIFSLILIPINTNLDLITITIIETLILMILLIIIIARGMSLTQKL